MPNSILTVDEIQGEMLTRLGASMVAVELSDDDYASAIRSTVVLYNRYRAPAMTVGQRVTPTVKKYPLDYPGIMGIVDIDFTPFQVHPGIDPFDPQTLVSAVSNSTGQTFGELDLEMSYQENAQRIWQGLPDSFAQWERERVSTGTDALGQPTYAPGPATYAPRYYLYVDLPQTATMFNCSLTYLFRITPDDNTATGLMWVSETDVDWFFNYCECKCKQLLGRALRKHGGTPTADGGTESTDGEALVSEGRESEITLREEIKNRRRPLMPQIE